MSNSNVAAVAQQRGKNQPSARFLESPMDDQAKSTNGNMKQAVSNANVVMQVF